MIAFAFIDANGIPTGGGMSRELPKQALALTEPFTTLDLPRLQLIDGVWVERSTPAQKPRSAKENAEQAAGLLRRARSDIAAEINASIGRIRLRLVTDIPGQEALYLEKRTEAVAYVAETAQGGEPADLADYPLLAAEVGVTAPDAWQLAQLWLNRAELFRRVGATTEGLRQRALADIADAPDFAAIETIQRDFNQALSGLSI